MDLGLLGLEMWSWQGVSGRCGFYSCCFSIVTWKITLRRAECHVIWIDWLQASGANKNEQRHFELSYKCLSDCSFVTPASCGQLYPNPKGVVIKSINAASLIFALNRLLWGDVGERQPLVTLLGPPPWLSRLWLWKDAVIQKQITKGTPPRVWCLFVPLVISLLCPFLS